MAIPQIITWDWKAQPDWDKVLEALDGTFTDGPRIFIIDTQSDEYGIVVGERTMSKAEAQKWFDEHKND